MGEGGSLTLAPGQQGYFQTGITVYNYRASVYGIILSFKNSGVSAFSVNEDSPEEYAGPMTGTGGPNTGNPIVYINVLGQYLIPIYYKTLARICIDNRTRTNVIKKNQESV